LSFDSEDDRALQKTRIIMYNLTLKKGLTIKLHGQEEKISIIFLATFAFKSKITIDIRIYRSILGQDHYLRFVEIQVFPKRRFP